MWEDLGNGYLTKKPKPKTTEVIISEDNSPDDSGTVRLKIDVVNAGNSPRVHYAEDSEKSPVLSDNSLATKALRVQFLAIDPTGKNLTGSPKTWENRLVVRNNFDDVSRILLGQVRKRERRLIRPRRSLQNRYKKRFRWTMSFCI